MTAEWEDMGAWEYGALVEEWISQTAGTKVLSGSVLAGMCVMARGGYSTEKAAAEVIMFDRNGYDPVAMARKMVTLRRAAAAPRMQKMRGMHADRVIYDEAFDGPSEWWEK